MLSFTCVAEPYNTLVLSFWNILLIGKPRLGSHLKSALVLGIVNGGEGLLKHRGDKNMVLYMTPQSIIMLLR